MSLADEIASIPTDAGCCTTGRWYLEQDNKVREAFDTYLADVAAGRRKHFHPLWQVCCSHGLSISSKSFREHCHSHHSLIAAK